MWAEIYAGSGTMHTILMVDDAYYVGMWVRDNQYGAVFKRLFKFEDRVPAIRCVNVLNGGPGYRGDVVFTGVGEEVGHD